jgi:hypothetical protein
MSLVTSVLKIIFNSFYLVWLLYDSTLKEIRKRLDFPVKEKECKHEPQNEKEAGMEKIRHTDCEADKNIRERIFEIILNIGQINVKIW